MNILSQIRRVGAVMGVVCTSLTATAGFAETRSDPRLVFVGTGPDSSSAIQAESDLPLITLDALPKVEAASERLWRPF